MQKDDGWNDRFIVHSSNQAKLQLHCMFCERLYSEAQLTSNNNLHFYSTRYLEPSCSTHNKINFIVIWSANPYASYIKSIDFIDLMFLLKKKFADCNLDQSHIQKTLVARFCQLLSKCNLLQVNLNIICIALEINSTELRTDFWNICTRSHCLILILIIERSQFQTNLRGLSRIPIHLEAYLHGSNVHWFHYTLVLTKCALDFSIN